MAEIGVEHCRSMSSIDAEAWDGLGRHTAFTRHGWLAAVERFATGPERLHLLVARHRGELVGSMVLRYQNDPHSADSLVRRVFGGGRTRRTALGRLLLPGLVAGAPHGYGGELLLADGISEELGDRVANALLDAAEALSGELRTRLWFDGVREEDRLTLRLLGHRSYLRSHYLPLAAIDVDWKCFDEYLEWQKLRSRNRARNIRRERERCAEAGVSLVEPDSLSGLGPVLVRLADQTLSKYEAPQFPFAPGIFQVLRERLGDAFMACTAMKDGQVIGFVTLISDGDTAWIDSYGLDYERAGQTFTYFSLIHYWPVEQAIRHNLKRVVFGRGQYEAKLARGCRLIDSFVFCRRSGGLSRPIYRALFGRLDNHYKRWARSAAAD